MNMIYIDSEPIETDYETENVTLGFPEDYERDEDARVDDTNPEAWCNSAGIQVTHDSMRVWISTGDPRGAFQMEIRKLDNGEMFISLPHPSDGMPHEDTEEVSPGHLLISRSKAEEEA